MPENYWDILMGDDAGAANYMTSYGEGVGCQTRMIIGSFINDGESVLDEGCGPGLNYDHFLECGPKVSLYLGRDYSERFVRVANQRHPGMYQVGDCRNITEADNSWDVVLLQDVLEHTNGYEKPVREALRVARKRVIVTFWRNFDNVEKINDDGKDGYGAQYNGEKWRKFLDNLGYHWLETETDHTANRWHSFFVIDKDQPHGA